MEAFHLVAWLHTLDLDILLHRKWIWRKGSLRNSPITRETYQNQHVATDDDKLQ